MGFKHGLFWIVLMVTVLGNALARSPQDTDEAKKIERRIKEARIALSEKKYNEGLKKFDEILAAEPEHMEAQLGRLDALAYLERTNDVKAIAAKATSKAKPTMESLTIAGNAKLWQRDLAGALTDLKKATEMKPNEAYYAHYLLGFIERLRKDYDSAISHLVKAIEIEEEFPEPYYLLGDVYFRRDDSSNVIKYWREYLNKVPAEGERYRYVLQTLQQLGG
jgi:tetratricopeptide (TPR) repeat protein